MANLVYHNVSIEKAKDSDRIIIRGEICNLSTTTYSAVAVRLILFLNNVIIANTVFTIHGLPNNSTKAFERIIEDLEFSKIGKDIKRYEINTESCF